MRTVSTRCINQSRSLFHISARPLSTASLLATRPASSTFPTSTSSSAVFRPVSLRAQRRMVSNWPKITKENPLGLDDPSIFVQHGIVGGKHVGAEGEKTFNVTNPATGDVIGTVPDMTRADTKKAIQVAYDTFKTFRSTSPVAKSEMLTRLHQLMVQHEVDLARLIVWENGKSYTDALAESKYATIPCSLPGARNFSMHQPLGVVALLVPWNFPAAMITRKIGPAIATGCTSVIKVPSETPYTNLAIMELAKRAGVPDGVLNVITTDNDTNLQEVGDELATNPLVKKLSLTGSTRVGKMLAAKGADSLKKMSLELGGNAPLVVFDDADLPTAVQGTIASKFRGSGQTCVCANRIYVQESVYDKFAEMLAEKVNQFKVGPGFDDGVTHGPLIHKRQVDKVQSHLDDAVSKGAKVIAGGKKLEGTMFQPTVLANVPEDCLITAEETFGPLAALIKFKTEDQVIKMANDTEFGLAGYFFSRDSDRIWRVADQMDVGMIGANTGAISQAIIPFGGVKESGYGREGGMEGIREYQTTKVVVLGTSLHNIKA